MPPTPASVLQPQPGSAANLKGRGTAWAMPHRFEAEQREAFDDGWGSMQQGVSEETLPPSTSILEEQAVRILSSNQSPDIPFDQSINPYRGCEHVICRLTMCV